MLEVTLTLLSDLNQFCFYFMRNIWWRLSCVSLFSCPHYIHSHQWQVQFFFMQFTAKKLQNNILVHPPPPPFRELVSPLVDLRRGPPNSFNSMQFLGNFGKIVSCPPPPRVDASRLSCLCVSQNMFSQH